MTANFSRIMALWALFAILLANGCSRPDRALRGGTEGLISIGGNTLPELQVNVFADDELSPQRIAFGVSNADGQFSLITNDGQNPMSLPPGKYRITVESVAADPIPVNPEYGDANTTPLVTEWSESDNELVVDVK